MRRESNLGGPQTSKISESSLRTTCKLGTSLSCFPNPSQEQGCAELRVIQAHPSIEILINRIEALQVRLMYKH